MSCKVREAKWSLIWWRAEKGREEVPVEVSNKGSKGTLKSPPNIRSPDWKSVGFVITSRKKATRFKLGQYTLASVISLLFHVPFRNRNLPAGSSICSVMLTWKVLESRIETPLDLESGHVAWSAVGKRSL